MAAKPAVAAAAGKTAAAKASPAPTATPGGSGGAGAVAGSGDNKQAEWMELKTQKGSPYFVSRITGELSVLRPTYLKQSRANGGGAAADDAADWVWVKDPVHLFVPAKRLEETKNGMAVVQTRDGQQREVPNKDPDVQPIFGGLDSTLR